MYYSLTFVHERPKQPLFFGFDNRTYHATDRTGVAPKNTWWDWHLVPTERPSIAPPELKTKNVDIPGMNGDLDFTESLTGYPVYENRKGSIEFLVITGYEHWHEIYQSMCSYLHGRKLYFAMEDDPAYYYCGYITVDQYQSNKDNSKITINYDLEPCKYEYAIGQNSNIYYWDITDFVSDNFEGVKYTRDFMSKEINSDEYVEICSGRNWGNYTEFPVIPTIDITTTLPTDTVTIHFENEEMDIDFTKDFAAGTYVIPQIIFTQINNVGKTHHVIGATINYDPKEPMPLTYDDLSPKRCILEAKGHGTVTITGYPGRK